MKPSFSHVSGPCKTRILRLYRTQHAHESVSVPTRTRTLCAHTPASRQKRTRLRSTHLTASGAAGDGRAARPRVPQAAARLAPRGLREVNGNEHVRAQREHQPANCDAPVARRRSRPAAPRRRTSPRARSFGRRSTSWPATRSSSRERVLVVVRRVPHCEVDADANAAGDAQYERELLLKAAAASEAPRAVSGALAQRS